MEQQQINKSSACKQQQTLLRDEQEEEAETVHIGLCCCEYINLEQQRYHLLECCCNCADFDAVFTQLICCHSLDTHNLHKMWQTLRDRFRIPWRGGAKQVPLESIVPALLLPLVLMTAALNQYLATFCMLLMVVGLIYGHYRVQKQMLRTRFFCMWLFWSLVYMIVLFESTVPLLEVLPEENLLLVILSCLSILCLWRTRQRAILNHVQPHTPSACSDDLVEVADEDEVPLTNCFETVDSEAAATAQQSICSTCRKYVPARTAHCSLCGACILRHDHHSYWLDCCIGKGNHGSYLLGMLLGAGALLLGANFILTAVCHPLLVQRVFGVPLMLPDDCSQVFDEYEFSLSFMLAIYAVTMAFYIELVLIQQIYLASVGLTLNERRRGQERNHRSICTNWKNLLFG